jgi:hypothetical protein
MTNRPSALTIAFYLVFALWFTEERYTGVDIYGWHFGAIAANLLRVAIVVTLLSVAALVVRRSIRSGKLLLLDASILGVAIIGADLFWRFYLSPYAWYAFKLASVVIDLASPLIVVLGVFAARTMALRPTDKSLTAP